MTAAVAEKQLRTAAVAAKRVLIWSSLAVKLGRVARTQAPENCVLALKIEVSGEVQAREPGDQTMLLGS